MPPHAIQQPMTPEYLQRVLLGEFAATPSYRYDELLLGYQTDMIFLRDGHGLPLDRIQMHRIANTRKTNPDVEAFIQKRWEEEQQRYSAHDAPRARFEGSAFDSESNTLHVSWSPERYKTHAAIRHAPVGKGYQAALWTVNVVLYTEDRKLPVGVRNETTTDQGKIRHLSPVGFMDVKVEGEETVDVESVADAAMRVLHSEWEVPEGVVRKEEAELLGIVHNSFLNHDYTATVFLPVSCQAEELESKKIRSGANPRGKYDGIEMVPMGEAPLRALLLDMVRKKDKTSGHARGDVALTIGRLHGGMEKYFEVIEDTLLKAGALRPVE